MTRKKGIIPYILIIAYLAIVLYYTVISREPSETYFYELTPFKTIRDFLSVDYDSHGQYILREVLVNIGLLMPVGSLLGFQVSRGFTFQKVLLFGLLTSLSIETLQLITKSGTFEVDDLIWNTLGCIVGYGIARLIRGLQLTN